MAQGGRPAGPTAATEEQVLVAAFRLLAEEGPQEVTPVRIHAETGIARTTIYRHWPDRVELLSRPASFDAPTAMVSPQIATEVPKKSPSSALKAVSFACWDQASPRRTRT